MHNHSYIYFSIIICFIIFGCTSGKSEYKKVTIDNKASFLVPCYLDSIVTYGKSGVVFLSKNNYKGIIRMGLHIEKYHESWGTIKNICKNKIYKQKRLNTNTIFLDSSTCFKQGVTICFFRYITPLNKKIARFDKIEYNEILLHNKGYLLNLFIQYPLPDTIGSKLINDKTFILNSFILK